MTSWSEPIAVALALGLVLAACTGGDGTDTLTVQLTGEPEDIAVYELVAEAFEQEHPGVDIQVVGIGSKGDHLQRLATSFAAGSPPDVFLLNFREYSSFVTQGAIEPAGPLATAAGIDFSQLFDAPVDAFTYDGEVQCLPQNVSSLVVYVNRSLFEGANLAAPTEDWTWDDFTEVATTIGAATADAHGAGIAPKLIRLAPFVWSAGGELVDDVDDPTVVTLDDPAARSALRWFLSLERSDDATPTPVDIAAQDAESRFAAGRLGMFLSSRREVPAFREISGLDWDVVALPRHPGTGDNTTLLHSDAFCIAKGATSPELAAEFAAYAVAGPGADLLALGGRTVPVVRRVATTVFLDPTQQPLNDQVFVDNADRMRATPVLPAWPEIEDAADRVIERGVADTTTNLDELVDRVVREIEEATRPLFERGA